MGDLVLIYVWWSHDHYKYKSGLEVVSETFPAVEGKLLWRTDVMGTDLSHGRRVTIIGRSAWPLIPIFLIA
ncbi:hypothetical protein Nepgr_023856 [Nepenthes gracilis]|uniref:Uncharacterized protein n=1 Tax=Nepenthes gracilis TaxID=150966 RepID=A0AAD3T2X2_NEPGR|nr:hypothetical protein Nepgr_023856 [Nepenthes gracilis]